MENVLNTTNAIQNICNSLVLGVQEIYKDQALEIILYGSVARGTQTEESDIDIAVITSEYETIEMKERLVDLVVDLELEYNVVLSVLRIDNNKFNEWKNVLPFYKNVIKEGIVLWQGI